MNMFISSMEWLMNTLVLTLILGIMAGDIHVRILVEKHKEFTRQGADLFMDKKISLLEALTGTNYLIKGLDGK
jgi:DnaJ-class molecular chaperone